MPSHDERIRRNYQCPICDGTGRLDDYEGEYPCYECDGAGVLLRPYTPPPQGKALSPLIADWLTAEMVRTLKNDLHFAKLVSREYK